MTIDYKIVVTMRNGPYEERSRVAAKLAATAASIMQEPCVINVEVESEPDQD